MNGLPDYYPSLKVSVAFGGGMCSATSEEDQHHDQCIQLDREQCIQEHGQVGRSTRDREQDGCESSGECGHNRQVKPTKQVRDQYHYLTESERDHEYFQSDNQDFIDHSSIQRSQRPQQEQDQEEAADIEPHTQFTPSISQKSLRDAHLLLRDSNESTDSYTFLQYPEQCSEEGRRYLAHPETQYQPHKIIDVLPSPLEHSPHAFEELENGRLDQVAELQARRASQLMHLQRQTQYQIFTNHQPHHHLDSQTRDQNAYAMDPHHLAQLRHNALIQHQQHLRALSNQPHPQQTLTEAQKQQLSNHQHQNQLHQLKLDQHYNTHANIASNSILGAQRKHVCDVCQKTFTRPSTLKVHMNSHTGLKPHPCTAPLCKWRFSVSSNLNRHLALCPHLNPKVFVNTPHHYTSINAGDKKERKEGKREYGIEVAGNGGVVLKGKVAVKREHEQKVMEINLREMKEEIVHRETNEERCQGVKRNPWQEMMQQESSIETIQYTSSPAL